MYHNVVTSRWIDNSTKYRLIQCVFQLQQVILEHCKEIVTIHNFPSDIRFTTAKLDNTVYIKTADSTQQYQQ